jgi:hypothetical protein
MTARDWWLLASGATWVLGAAIVLAAASWFTSATCTRGPRWRDAWRGTAWPAWHARGMLLVAAGFGSLPGSPWWERGLWAAVALGFIQAALGPRATATPARRRPRSGIGPVDSC